jgi:predicted nucleic acid-binding protein
MNGFLLDTNCISELLSLKPEPRVLSWMEAADEAMLYLSVLTIGEIRKGVAGLAQGKRRLRLEHWLAVHLPDRFAGRILSVDASIADRWGSITAAAKRTGRTLSVIDSLLAATAIEHNLTVVSRNASDFTYSQAQALDPWEA